MADEYNAALKTTYRSVSLIYQPVLPAQPHTRHQHRYRRTLFVSALRPATIRSESTCSQARGELSLEPIETENTDKTEDTEQARRDLLRDLPEWFEEFTENLVDESVPAHRDAPASSSRESASEPRGKVVSGKHSTFTHFPKDRNCDICMKTKITRDPCRQRTGAAVPRSSLSS